MRPATVSTALKIILLMAVSFSLGLCRAQNNLNIRVMAANLNGNTQSYQPFALRILQGLKPDVVAIQEFNYTSTNGLGANTAAAFREMIDTACGTNFVYYREPHTASGDIPNGILSRWPIVNSGSWTDTEVGNRGFAWAQIQLPGTNSLYVVSVHLLTSSATARSAEATELQALIQSNFPTNAWVVLAGDFNTGSRTEATAMTTFDSFLSDFPVPVDNNGNSFTSENRNYPHDYVLPSFALTNFETATIFPSHTFPSGLVFDSTVYTPLSDVAPVQFGDSTNAQHMAVIKDFSISTGPDTNPPAILTQPQSQTNAVGVNISFSVAASGSGTLNYQWLFNGTNLSGATANPLLLANSQLTNSGNYSVIVTNLFGSATSSNAVLLLTNAPPSITVPPQSQSILAGQSVAFSVAATGTPPLNYQWLFNGTNIFGATTNSFSLANVQATNGGNYSVIVSNFAGSVTSSPALLTVVFTNPVIFAQWNFNSVPPDANTATGSTVPNIGTGTATAIGGVVASFVGGDATLDPAPAADNSAWTTVTYPAATANNKSAGVQFAVSTAGKQNIAIGWSQRSSNTGGKYFRLQYSTNSGASFTDFPAAVTVTNVFTGFTNDLTAFPDVNNNSNFVFRIVGEFQSTATGSGSAAYVAAGSGSTYASSGTSRFDMVTVSGTAFLAATPAVLTRPAAGGSQFGFTISGSAGLNYIVQASTNLSSSNWQPVFTNVAPFDFGDTNIFAPQKFYRAVSQ